MDPKESAKQQKLKKELGQKMSGKYINFYSTGVGIRIIFITKYFRHTNKFHIYIYSFRFYGQKRK